MSFVRAVRRWFIPYLNSRTRSGEFRPILSYLFTEWKCNIDCHYCWAWNDTRDGMTLDTAKSSIDFLRSVGCRVVAIMGGEPLLRKDFIINVIRYASGSGFFVYLPTNGYLMEEEFIDQAGEAGVSAVNLAVDCVVPRRGLPKALMAIEPQFRALLARQRRYGYILFFNINITRKNLADVKMLTEIAHDNRIGTDYHINEPEIIEHEHFTHRDSDLYFTERDREAVNDLIDWIIEKNRKGHVMVNSVDHLLAMKGFVRNDATPWPCRAGLNSLFIGADGSLAPCFGQYGSGEDWGTIWNPRLDPGRLEKLKASCSTRCLSTCNYNLAHYYSPSIVHEWIMKQARRRLAGI
jgi:MoaA/NifB/PqqE/SkfB family radical SAM enzyme